ncbi:MAG: type II secretion system F family protein [Desulfobacteraceae bacterium]|nr:type II secretion system F family protein [Desulfobacteraceae bacterium]MBC2718270.1 type II secretion system F family protein [Desulfobacteraceae bacterium]
MPIFYCKMTEMGGRIVEETITADSKAILIKRLKKEGNFVLEIRREEGFGSLKKGISRRRIKANDLLSFNREFSVLIRTGLSIVAALDAVIEKDEESELSKILKKIRDDITAGESLSGAFRKYSNIFSKLYVASLQAGERSGNIPLAISRYIEYIKKMSDIKQKVISASVYPLILVMASFFVLLFLLIFVVPVLTESFLGSDTQLPFITVILVNFSTGLKSYVFYVLFLLICLVAGFYYFKKSDFGRLCVDRWKLNIPFLGDLYLHYSISKLTRTLNTVLSGGIPLVETVKLSSGTLNNHFLKLRLDGVVKSMEEGESFSASLLKTKAFPSMAVRMIFAGESGGALEQVLDDIADFYASDVDIKLSILTSAIEPALMVIMGFIIGFIVLAMYMPIFQLAGATA